MIARSLALRADRLAATLLLCLAAAGCEAEETPAVGPEATADAAPADAADAAVDLNPDAAVAPVPDAAPLAPDAAPAERDPWPDPLPSPDARATLVHAGVIVPPEHPLRITAPPAGLEAVLSIELVLTWRGEDPIAFDPDPAAWLAAEGYTWVTAPPAMLDPDESARLHLAFDPTLATEAGAWPATLTVPGTALRFELVADVPRPLRMAFVTGDGQIWLSDGYGLDPRPVGEPLAGTARHRITWGAGRFFRSYASGPEWADPGRYAYSADGVEWISADAADAFWASRCAWGIDRFTCAISSQLSWSTTGAGVVHEAQTWRGMIHDMIFVVDRWIGVGRDGRRAVSLDGARWTHDVYDMPEGADGGWFESVAALDDDTIIALGGRGAFNLAVSHDRGMTWTVEHSAEGIGELIACLPGHCLLTVGNNAPRLRESVDGETWTGVQPDVPVSPLGAANGWFFGVTRPWRAAGALYRSRDGVTWELLHQLEEPGSFQDLAIERWEDTRWAGE